NIGGKILGAFKSVFGISSPSTLTTQIGLNIMQGLTNGVSDGTPAAVTQASNAGGKVVDAIVKGLKSQGIKVTEGFQQALDSALKSASPRDVSGVAHATGDAFVSGLQGVLNAG